jgi:hypothetical protein
MALSAGDASTIATHLKRNAGAADGGTDTATVALWIRSRWGGTGTDAQVIALFAEARRDPDLVQHAAKIRLRVGGIS